MKIRLIGTEAECAKLCFLLRYGPRDLDVVEVSPPYPNRGDRRQVRVYLEARFPEGLAPLASTFYSLTGPNGRPLLTDAWQPGGRGQLAVSTTYAYVEFLLPTATGPACQACEGQGVTGKQYHLPTGEDRVLVVDVFCPACGGCGNADHQDCGGWHVGAMDDWTASSEPLDDDDLGEDRCPSCQSREWNPVQGFDPDDPDAYVRVLRVPCGCTTARARTWTVAGEPEGR